MKDISNRNLGLLIAHVLPGFIALGGLQDVSPTVRLWMSAASSESDLPTVGGFLYVTLASVALGMTVGAIRWCVIDTIHHYTGLVRPVWNETRLQANLHAFDMIVEQHYRYYQFYANTIVSLVILYAARRVATGYDEFDGSLELGLIALGIVFLATSRNNLYRYYSRTLVLMNSFESDFLMSNGNHPHSPAKPQPTPPKPETKPAK